MTERERAEAEVAEKERALTDAFEAPGGSWYDVPPSMVREGFADVAESGVNALKDLLIGATIGAEQTRTQPVWEEPLNAQEFGEVASMAMAPLAVGGRALLKRITNPIRTFHGSPHVFEQPYRFDLDKIGTGEGVQAYGHGGYFAENLDTAKTYQPRTYEAEDILARMAQDAERAQDYGAYGVIEDAMLHRTPHELRAIHGPEFEELIKRIESLPQTGGLYEVDLHVRPETLIDLDKFELPYQPSVLSHSAHYPPLSEQSPEVAEALLNVEPLNDFFHLTRYGAARELMQQNPVLASERLRRLGVPGSSYLDQGSRDAGQGTRNYVIWDPDVIDVRRKLAALLAVGGGATAADAFDQTPVEFGGQ